MSNLSVRSACAILSSNNVKAILSSLVRPVQLYLQFCGGLTLEADRRSISGPCGQHVDQTVTKCRKSCGRGCLCCKSKGQQMDEVGAMQGSRTDRHKENICLFIVRPVTAFVVKSNKSWTECSTRLGKKLPRRDAEGILIHEWAPRSTCDAEPILLRQYRSSDQAVN